MRLFTGICRVWKQNRKKFKKVLQKFKKTIDGIMEW